MEYCSELRDDGFFVARTKETSDSGSERRASMESFSNFEFWHALAKDCESSFDPEPSMASLPKYVSPSKQYYDGSITRSQREDKAFELFTFGESSVKQNYASSCMYANTASPRPANELAHPPAGLSSHVLRHGQFTPPSSGSLSPGKTSEDLEQTSRKRASYRTKGRIGTEVKASSSSSSSCPVSDSSVIPITKGISRTRKPTVQRNQPVVLSEYMKRKLSLEKNKIAAANCRAKKQKREEQLQARSQELVSSNTILKKTVLDLTENLQQMQSVLGLHVMGEGCKTPTQIREVLSGQSVDDSIHQMDLCDDDGSELISELYQDQSHLKSSDAQEISVQYGDFQTSPSVEDYSSPGACVFTTLDFTEDFDMLNTTALDDSYFVMLGDTSNPFTPPADENP